MVTISINISEDELSLFKSYAEKNHGTLSEIIRKTMLERIEEDEYDLKVFEEYEAEIAAGTLKATPFNEFLIEFESK